MKIEEIPEIPVIDKENLRGEFLMWLRNRKLSDRTINEYLNYYDKFLFESGIDQIEVNAFIHRFNNSPARAFMKNFLEFAEEFYDDPLNLNLPKIKGRKGKKIPEIVDEQETNLLAKYMTNERNRIMVLITFYGGLRCDEMLNIKIKNFHLNKWIENPKSAGELKVLGKGKRERIVYLPSNLMRAIHKYLRKITLYENIDDAEYKPFKISIRHWNRLVHQASEKALGRKINPHLLRHSLASSLLDKGWQIDQIQIYLGHQSVATTEIYLHNRTRHLKDKYMSTFNQPTLHK